MNSTTPAFVSILMTLCLAVWPASMARADADGARAYLKRPDAWFSTPEAKKVAANILSWQSSALGGWPKNNDTAAKAYVGDPEELNSGHVLHPTYDNDATTDEMRYLARMYNATHEQIYKDAFNRGLGYLLKGQYPTGGWPQSYPPDHQYHRYITFNDDAMVRIMQMLQEINASDRYGFVDPSLKSQATDSFNRGIECILKCQIKVNGKLTVWCAQHDEKDLSPREGRAFELASLSGSESVGITRLLMSLDKPNAQVVQAVGAAVVWFESAKITGMKVIEVDDSNGPHGKDRKIVPDASAPPLWARFYDIQTNRPLFANRDRTPMWNFSDLNYERRNGYTWYGPWATPMLNREYPAWKKKVQARAATEPSAEAKAGR